VKKKVFFQNSKGNRLCGILSDPTEDRHLPIMVLCHGFSTSKGGRTYVRLEKIFNLKKYSTFRFDFFGHGESEGDLRLWRVKTYMPPELVYQRMGLMLSRHKVEITLERNAQYFWSSRARFDFAGEIRATRWSAYRIPYYDVRGIKLLKPQATPAIAAGYLRDPCNLDFIPTANYYRFATP